MKDDILMNLNDAGQLEKLYRNNKTSFKRTFTDLYPEVKGTPLADFWHERFTYESDELNWGTSRELSLVIIIAIIAGLLAKFPAFFHIKEDFFYPRNVGLILFPALSAYFAWKNKLSAGKIAFIGGAFVIGLIFINVLPDDNKSDTLILACLHLVFGLWIVLGFAYTGEGVNNHEKWMGYLKYNGDVVVMSALILIACGLMTGITVGLFELLGLDIKEFYFKNIVIFGLPVVPVAATYLTQTNPQLVGKVSPVIAKIFSPLVLVMLVVYLTAMIWSGKNPYNNREFLIIFNALLVGVMALIFFSVAENSAKTKTNGEMWILFLLSIVTIIVNGIALSAILFRISSWGFTPNRAAILGGNVLMLVNLVLVTMQLFKIVSRKRDTTGVGKVIATYLPVYCLWAIIVTFIFPLIFSFK